VTRFDHQFVAMGGPCHLRLDCEDDATAQLAIVVAEAEVRRLEQKYSRYLDDSITSAINRQAGTGKTVSIDDETAGLLHYADTLWRESEGMFDLTSGILRQAWDFKAGRIPQQQQIDDLLPLIGWDKVAWSEAGVRLAAPGMEVDFGGCVKEYACDCAAGVLRQQGIYHALVDLAGDMAATGPQHDGTPWPIGIRRPDRQTQAIAEVSLSSGALASSGTYERYLMIEGKRYGHILNPKTGWPVEGLTAVSVMAEQCLVAGSAATAAMLKPAPEALVWLDQLGLPWLAVDENMQVWLDQLGLPWLAVDENMQCHGRIGNLAPAG
jgi:thiamine biosynthesis lipoprotein